MASPEVAAPPASQRQTEANRTPTEGTDRPENSIHVSTDRYIRYYVRFAKRIMMGREDKEPFDEISISGLGMATKIAISAAAILQEEGCVTIERVETSFFPSTNRRKNVPRITLFCKKTKDFDAIMEKEKEAKAAAPPRGEQAAEPELVKA